MINDMTTEEKRLFAEKMTSGQGQKNLKYGKNRIIFYGIVGIIGAVGLITLKILNIITAPFIVPLVLVVWGYGIAVQIIRGYKAMKNAVKDASYGKVTYKEYKQLVKSGELEKWLTEKQNSNQTTVDNTVEQLTPEELAVLKKLIQKQDDKN